MRRQRQTVDWSGSYLMRWVTDMNKFPKIIALCGYKGSGKDTAAAFFAQKKYKHVKLAAPLKRAVNALFDFSPLEKDKEKIDPYWGISPRYAMQKMGTEIFQQRLYLLLKTIPPNGFWAKRLLKNYRGEKIVVSDLRFGHEYLALKEADKNLCVIRIERGLPPLDHHISECAFRDIPANFVIENKGTKEEFYSKLQAHTFSHISLT